MLKNKTAKALIIGTCMVLGSTAGVFADETAVTRPALIEKIDQSEKIVETERILVPDKIAEEDQIMTIQIMSINENDVLVQKQREIDNYVFKHNSAELEKRGIRVSSTGIVGDTVEIAIAPYDAESADYLYEIFGKEMVTVVEEEAAVPLDLVTITVNKSAESADAVQKGFFSAFKHAFNNIVEWIKGIF